MPNLEHLKKLLGDEAIVARFLELLRSQMPVQIADLQKQVAEQDWEHAGATAHAIKGQLGYLQATAAVDLALRLEELAEGGGGEEAQTMAALLKTQVEAILAAIA